MDCPYRETLERFLAIRCQGLRPGSIWHCRMCVRSLLSFLRARYPELGSLSKLRRAPHIEDWLQALKSHKPPYTDGTRYLFIYHARRFLVKIHEWGWLESPPPALILPGDFPPRRRSTSGLPRPSWRRSIPGCPLADTALHRSLERYLALRAPTEERELLRHYRSDVLSLIEFLRGRFPEIDSFAKLSREPVAGWLEWLSALKPPYTADTRRGMISHVKRFLRDLRELVWEDSPPPGLFRRGDLPPRRNPFRRKKGPPAPRKRSVPTVVTFPLDTPFHQTLKRYLEVRGTTLRLGTLWTYRTDVLSLIRFLHLEYPELDCFSKLNRQHIEGWLQTLLKGPTPLKNDTRRERIRTLVRFLDDLRDWNWPEAPPPGLIRLDDFPPCDHHLPRPLPPDVDAALMEALRTDGHILSLGLILDRRTGLRIGELSHLELDCLLEDSPGRYSLRVPLGKLRSERVIPIEPETAELIRTIRELRGERPPGVDPETGRSVEALFPNPWNDCIGTGAFRRKLRSVVQSAGITENVHPHRLRHSYATELLRNGLGLVGVMKLLGHKSLKMTLRYVEVTNEDLGRDYLRAMESARQRYSTLRAIESSRILEEDESSGTIAGAFDQLIGRIQARRFEEPDPRRRRALQRLVERLRRAKRTLTKPPP